jgi:hypothetical protein
VLDDGDGRLDWLRGVCEGLSLEQLFLEATFSAREIQGCFLVDASESVLIGDVEIVQDVLKAEMVETDVAEVSEAS